MVTNLPANAESAGVAGLTPGLERSPGVGNDNPLQYSCPVFLPGKSHRWRSLVGCSPWGHEESDTTERLHFHFSLLCIEGKGNPLQCSCLENPRDGVAELDTTKVA